MNPFVDRQFLSLIVLILIWTLPWKGVALWRAARNGHTAWFVILLVVNTVALLEIVYIFFFSKKGLERKSATETVTSAAE
ncbi:MAG: DUF5652 family protein [Candidatus Moraniibacteriota bacterium]